MNQMYGFDGEVKAKYSAQMAELFTEVYNWLPLAHCLNNRILVSLHIIRKKLNICNYVHIISHIFMNFIGNAWWIIFKR